MPRELSQTPEAQRKRAARTLETEAVYALRVASSAAQRGGKVARVSASAPSGPERRRAREWLRALEQVARMARFLRQHENSDPGRPGTDQRLRWVERREERRALLDAALAALAQLVEGRE